MKGIGKRFLKRKVGIGIVLVQAIISAVLVALISRFGLPMPYLIGIGFVLVLLLGLMCLSQASKGKFHYPAKAISIILSVLLVVGCFTLYKTYGSLDSATGNNKKSEEMSIIVLSDNPASAVEDVKNDKFGIVSESSIEKNSKVVDQINEQLQTTINTVEYVDCIALVEALYNRDVDVIILSEGFRDLIEDNYDSFSKDTKVLDSFKHETEVNVNKTVNDVCTEPFNIFISGIDTYGDINNTSRSDVNIIATVNPVTKQVLLTSTPRDYYVPTTVSNGMEDKLTHAGLYGIECSVGTLEMLYGIEIDYYVKVNFTGFMGIVDALGGVTVHSDYTFTNDKNMTYYKGDNKLDGERAMWFVRERHSFASGDLQRNKNQQYLIKAIIDKASSPAILSGFNSIMNTVSESVVTNMQLSDITALVNMQLSDGASWNVVMNGVSGTGGKRTTYSNQSKKGYVMYPDEEQVAEATQMIQDVLDGKEISEEEEASASPSPSSSTSSSRN